MDCSSITWNLKYKHSYQCNLNSIIIIILVIIIKIVLEACSLRVGWECSWQPFATGDAGRDVVKCIAKLFPISTKSNQIILKNINLNRNFSLIDSSYFFLQSCLKLIITISNIVWKVSATLLASWLTESGAYI